MSPYQVKVYLEIGALLVGILGGIGFFKWFFPRLAAWWNRCVRSRYRRMATALMALESLPHIAHAVTGIPAMDTKLTVLADDMTQVKLDIVGVKSDSALSASIRLAQINNDPGLGYFECHPDGRAYMVADTLCRWLNMSDSDLLDLGYLNGLHPLDVEGFRNGLMSAIRDGRKYTALRVRLVPTTAPTFLADITFSPVPDSGAVQRWVVTVRRANDQ